MSSSEAYRISKVDFLKVISDPVLFIERFMKIDNQPAKLYDYQKKLPRDRSDNRAVEKARQLGLSLICAYEAVYYSFTKAPITNLFVSVTQNQSVELLRHAKVGWQSIPDKIVVYDEEGNEQVLSKGEPRLTQTNLELPNGSRIISLPNNPDAARGYRAHRVYWDEAAAFENEYEMLRAIGVTRVRGGALTYISTHHGTVTEFYKICEAARDKKSKDWNGFSLHTITWDMCPDEKYRKYVLGDQARQLGGVESIGFLEEFCCKPVDESVSFITKSMLDASIDVFKRTIDSVTQKPLELWSTLAYTGKNPVYIGLDVGRTHDSTIMVVIEDMGDYAVVRYLWELPKEPLPAQTKRITEVLKRTYFTKLWIDAIALGRQMAESLAGEFGSKIELVGTQGTAKAIDGDRVGTQLQQKERLVTDLYAAISSLKILLPPKESGIECERLYNQLHGLKREYSEKSHQVRYVGGEGVQDDYDFAIAMCVQGIMVPRIMAGVGVIGVGESEFISQTKDGIKREIVKVPETELDKERAYVRAITSRQYGEPTPRKMPCPSEKCKQLGLMQGKPIMMDLVQNADPHSKGTEWLCSVCWTTYFHVEADK